MLHIQRKDKVTYHVVPYSELTDEVKEQVDNKIDILNYFNLKYGTHYQLDELYYPTSGLFIGLFIDTVDSTITLVMQNKTYEVEIVNL